MKKERKLMFVTIRDNLSFEMDMNLSSIIESKIRNFAMTLAFFLNSRYEDRLLFERIKAFTEDYIERHK